jgi:hypothetical protein
VKDIKNGEKKSEEKAYKIEVGVGVEINMIENTISASLSLCLGLNDLFQKVFTKSHIQAEVQIVPGVSLGIDIKPFFDLKFCFGFGYFKNIKDPKDSYFFFDANAYAEVGINLEAGVYVPSVKSSIFYGFIVGLKGVLGSGKIGLQLKIFFKGKNKDLYSFDLFHEIQALSISLYVKMQLKISIQFFEFSFEFYLLNLQLITYKSEFHKIRYYEIKNSHERKDLCQEITIEGFSSTFMNQDKITNTRKCK